jgi:hypothetical protein
MAFFHTTVHTRSITKYSIHHDGLSILSIRRNVPGANISDWVDKLFGSAMIRDKELSPGNITFPNGTSLSNPFQLPDYAINPNCSFEILGFVKLRDYTPFSHYVKDKTIVGVAPMVISHSSATWNCFYRPMTEDWRVSKLYWSVFFFCATPDKDVCNTHHGMDHEGKMTGHVSMDQYNATWKSKFLSNIKVEPPKPTACLALPYKSAVPERALVNGAMIYEWVRYYSLLGFKVYVYDRDGANKDYIYNSAYGKANDQQGNAWTANIVYHPNTALSILDKNPRIVHYDSAIQSNQNNSYQLRLDNDYLDDDKTFTLTLCRFEASALDGSTRVLVADSDEFLYCPNGASSFAGQRHHITNIIDKYADNGVSQILYLQLTTAAKLANGTYTEVIDCLSDIVKKGKSIFDCYAGFEYNTGFLYHGKAIHLRHTCPLTNFHSGCDSKFCECPIKTYPNAPKPGFQIMPLTDHCSFMHLSTHPRDYDKPKYKLSNESRAIFEVTPSELSIMVNRKTDYYHIPIHI